ncbi:hypothetical protein BGZ65_007250, partial [Modicella reniformis]
MHNNNPSSAYNRPSTPPFRTQRALSLAAETRRSRDSFFISAEYPYTLPITITPSPPQNIPQQKQPVSPRHYPAPDSLFGDLERYQRSTPPLADNNTKEAKLAQRQRREQIVQMLQQEKLEKQQAKKQMRSEYKQMYQAHTNQTTTNMIVISFPHLPHQPPLGHNTSDPSRPLSLKNNAKSMCDLRPSKEPKPVSHDYQGYESDDNLPARSYGWDSLMETLHSPTMSSSPSDSASWESKDETDLDTIDSMSALSLADDDSGNGNGKYLLILGANGRTGIELVKQGLERNYRVTAFVRDDKLLLEDSSLRKNQNLLIVRGSPTSQVDVDGCVEGQDVVVNVIGARLMSNDTTIGSHSQVILNNALKKHGVRRLIVVTSYGCLGLRNYLINTKRLFSRVFMTGILKDKVLQEDIIQRDSESLDWTIV